jgi:hypothetical protein
MRPAGNDRRPSEWLAEFYELQSHFGFATDVEAALAGKHLSVSDESLALRRDGHAGKSDVEKLANSDGGFDR